MRRDRLSVGNERFINAMHRASLDGATAEQRDKELRHVA